MLHPKENLYNYRCKLLRVIDGDTIEVDVDLGFYTWRKITLRLADIDAPEVRTKDLDEKKEGIKSTEFLKDIISKNNEDSFIYIESKGVDDFGRSIATVYTEDGFNVNLLLLESGLAKKWN